MQSSNADRTDSFELSVDGRIYRVQQSTLGCGYRSKVRNGIRSDTGQRCAIKMVQKSSRESVNARARREIELLKKVQGHPNIVRLLDSTEDSHYIYLILERHEMTLLDHIERSGGKLSPSRAAQILKLVVSALDHCQSLNINHLDLKLENIMMDADKMPVLIDFGFAEEIPRGRKLPVGRGSFRYVPPEIAAYEEFEPAKADAWALGVLLYAMCAGRLPFSGSEDNVPRLFRQIRSGLFLMPPDFSEPLKDLVSGLLRVDPKLRLELPQIASHPFMALAPPTPMPVVDSQSVSTPDSVVAAASAAVIAATGVAAAAVAGSPQIFTAAALDSVLRRSSNTLPVPRAPSCSNLAMLHQSSSSLATSSQLPAVAV